MSCEVVCTASIRVLMLCLVTCVAYLVIFKMAQHVPGCCIVMSVWQ